MVKLDCLYILTENHIRFDAWNVEIMDDQLPFCSRQLQNLFFFKLYISQDLKMKKMAGMQAHIVSDPLSRQALDRQMTTWEENLERLYIEQFQLRCYLAALQRTEIPSSNVRTFSKFEKSIFFQFVDPFSSDCYSSQCIKDFSRF